MRKEGIPFDGFGSVVEMLRKADGPFREKILSGIRRRDPHLARRLEANLGPSSWEEESREALERGQRAAYTRTYGQ